MNSERVASVIRLLNYIFCRASTQNSHRSLPEIPHPVGRHDSGDTASEIYATVNLFDGMFYTIIVFCIQSV